MCLTPCGAPSSPALPKVSDTFRTAVRSGDTARTLAPAAYRPVPTARGLVACIRVHTAVGTNRDASRQTPGFCLGRSHWRGGALSRPRPLLVVEADDCERRPVSISAR